MPDYTDSKVLLDNPHVLWAGYLLILDEWEADLDPEKPSLAECGSPKTLGATMRIIAMEPKFAAEKLKWEILFRYGYAGLKRYYKWLEKKSQRAMDMAASSLEELA